MNESTISHKEEGDHNESQAEAFKEDSKLKFINKTPTSSISEETSNSTQILDGILKSYF